MQVHGEIRRSGFIDPKLLHYQSPDFEIEPDARGILPWEQNHDDLAFFNYFQDSSEKGKQLSQPEQRIIPRPPQATKYVSRNTSPGSLEIDVMSRHLYESYEEPNLKATEDGRDSYGIAISSGWSSTFFPYEMNDDSNNDSRTSITEDSI